MRIKVTIHLNGMEKIDEAVRKAEEVRKKNPHAEVNIEVHEND